MQPIKPMKSLADRLNKRRNPKDATSDEFAAVQEASDDPNIVRKLVKMAQKTTNPAATRDSPPARNIPLIGNASAPPSEEFFNNSLYNAAHPTSEIPEFDDECENLNNQMTAVKEGIKMRDFAFAPEAVLGLKPLTSGAMLDERVPILFQPIQPYKEFLYMRKVCFQAGKFDMPAIHLTPEDVDRLHTMGWISLHDVKDFALGREMLGNGLWKRRQREKGLPMENGKVLAPRAWTVSPHIRKPSENALEIFYRLTEYGRMGPTDPGISRYPIDYNKRPMYDRAQDNRHLQENGILALKKKGISNKLTLDLLEQRDVSFIPFSSAFVHPAPRKKYSDYESPSVKKGTKPMIIQEYKVPTKFENPSSLIIIETYELMISVSVNDEPPAKPKLDKETLICKFPHQTSDSSSSTFPAAQKDLAADTGAATSQSPKASKSKKHKRNESNTNDSPARRTRARVREEWAANEGPAYRTRARGAISPPIAFAISSSATDAPARRTSTRTAVPSSPSSYVRGRQQRTTASAKISNRKGKKHAYEDSPEESEVRDAALEVSPLNKLKVAAHPSPPQGHVYPYEEALAVPLTNNTMHQNNILTEGDVDPDSVATDDDEATPVAASTMPYICYESLTEEEQCKRAEESQVIVWSLPPWDREDWSDLDGFFDEVVSRQQEDRYGYVDRPPFEFHPFLHRKRREELWAGYETRKIERIRNRFLKRMREQKMKKECAR